MSKRPVFSVQEFDIHVPESQVFTIDNYDSAEPSSLYLSNERLHDLLDRYWEECERFFQKEITQLKKELKRERACVDFYASSFNPSKIKISTIKSSDLEVREIISGDGLEIQDIQYIGGKLAREIIAQREVDLD